MANTDLLSPEKIRNLVSYNPETGDLHWLARTIETWPTTLTKRAEWQCNNWNSAHAGKAITHLSREGYTLLQISGKQYRGHRVAWAIQFGEWPDSMIDHINGVRNDNRLSNLRLATDEQNARNACLPSSNKSGTVGVSFDNTLGKWVASIGVEGKTLHLGVFRTIDEAIACRKGAAKLAGYHPRHGQSRQPASSRDL